MTVWCLAARLNHNSDLILQIVNVQPCHPPSAWHGTCWKKGALMPSGTVWGFRGTKAAQTQHWGSNAAVHSAWQVLKSEG